MAIGEEHPALLVIDMQEAVLAGCTGVPGVIERINGLLGRARRSGAPIVFIQHQDAEDPELTAGSPGWRLVPGLDRREGDPMVAKGTGTASRAPSSAQSWPLRECGDWS